MLNLSRKPNQRILIGNDIEVHIGNVRGTRVSVGIVAPPGTLIMRGEVIDEARTKVEVMRPDRSVVLIDAKWMAEIAKLLGYARATDGTYIPECDLGQYELGLRPRLVEGGAA